jgi:hypothetical protein
MVVGGFGSSAWSPRIEGVRGDTKLCPPAREDELTTVHRFLSGSLDMLINSGDSLAGRLFLLGSPEKLMRSSSSLAGLFDSRVDDADALVLICMFLADRCLRVSLHSIIVSDHDPEGTHV